MVGSPRPRVSDFWQLQFIGGKPTGAGLADGNHCREIAGKLRELARYTRPPGIRRELIDLAKRYDRRGGHFEERSR